jgi:Ca-activated chloride channel family protein
MSVAFDLPWAALAAVALSVLSGVTFWLWHRRRVARLSQLGVEAAIERLAPFGVRRAPVARAIRVSASIGLAALAFAGPRWGTSANLVRTQGIDVVLAMDASLSMLAQDERPSRLERMKQDVRRFRASSPGDRVALLAFAGRSYILSPLTTDDGAIDLFLDNLDPSIVGQAGTAMAPTIAQGVDLLRAARGAAGRALVILSDGEAFDDRTETLAAARSARAAEIDIVTVGYGTEGGATIPIRSGNTVIQKLDGAGQVVVTKYDPALLRDVAGAANGEFIGAHETDKGARIHQALARLDAKQRSVAEGLSRPLRTTWFLLPAILLLLLDSWFADGGGFGKLYLRLRHAAPLLLIALLAAPLHAQAAGPDPLDMFKAGQFIRAAQRWKDQIVGGDKHPSTLYNLGTAMLAADSLDAAAEILERASTVPDAALRERALYNLGLAQLKRGMRTEAPDPRAFSSAVSAYRTLLRQSPGDNDAKFNYELALRLQKQQKGGGGSNNDNNSQPQQQPRSQADEDKSMSKQQAQQLLAAASREEKETQSRKQRGTKQERPPGGKDW